MDLTILDLWINREKTEKLSFMVNFIFLFIVSPVRMYVWGIIWFSRRYTAASASADIHRSHDNLINPYRIASIFDM